MSERNDIGPRFERGPAGRRGDGLSWQTLLRMSRHHDTEGPSPPWTEGVSGEMADFLKTRSRGYYRHLKRRMITIVVGVPLVPLLLIGALALYQFRSAYRDKVIAHMTALGRTHSQRIDRFLADRLAGIRLLARSHPIGDLEDGRTLMRLLRLLREEYGGVFVDLGLVGPSGVQKAYAGPFDLAGADYSKARWFIKARGRAHFISDVFTGLRKRPHFIVVATKRKSGSKSWYVRATVDFEAFNALVKGIRVGRSGSAFILDRRGRFQAGPRSEVREARGPYRDLIKGHLILTRPNVVMRPDARGRDSFFMLAPVKGGNWVLFFKQRARDALVQFHETRRQVLVILIFGGALIVGVAVVLSNRMVGRIVAVDRERAALNEKILEAGKLASIGQLAAGVAHEINNPVAIMVEEAGWIGDLTGDDDFGREESRREVQRAVDQIRSQGDRCKQITLQLLSFARKTDPQVVPVDVGNLVGETLGLLAGRSVQAGVSMESDFWLGLPPVMASVSELQQVLFNLVNNALDAIGPDGGVVSVRTRSVDGEVLIEVSDTGRGIPEDDLGRIFDPFFTTKPVGKGTGLGLSICYGIVNKLGGTISVDSEIGRGTTFMIRLPAAKRDGGDPGVT